MKDTQDVEIEWIKGSLERIESSVKDVHTKIDQQNGRVRKNERDISNIQGRASVAGVISGAVSGAVMGLLAYFGVGR